MAPTIDVKSCCNLASIGFLPFSQSLKFNLWREKIDPFWQEFCSKYGVEYDQNAFHVACSSHEGVNKSVLKYDKKYPNNPDPLVTKRAMQDLTHFFGRLENTCPIVPYDDIKINPDAVPGVVASKWFGLKNKEEAVIQMTEYCELFWEMAHIEEYPWLWKQSGKVELLKISKLEKNDIRGFTIVPFEGFTYAARLTQSLNEAMCDPSFYQTSPIKHGVRMSRGGFKMLLAELMHRLEDPDIIEGDCVKWDSGMIDILFEAILQIRYYCWDKKGMSSAEWWARMRYMYSQIRESFICLTTGQVIQKMFGNPSGQNSTTDDNCIGHLFILCLIWRIKYDRSLYTDFREKINIALYADDHLIACESGIGFSLYEERVAEYRKYGCDLDKAKDFVSKTFEGHTFLGLTMKFNQMYKCYVPHFSGLKALNTLEKYEKNYSVDQIFDRAVTILLLVSFDEEMYRIVRDYLRYLQDQLPTELFHRKIPSLNSCRSFWLCHEGSGGLDGDKKFLDVESILCEKRTDQIGQIRENYSSRISKSKGCVEKEDCEIKQSNCPNPKSEGEHKTSPEPSPACPFSKVQERDG